jgi:hypothetical protein
MLLIWNERSTYLEAQPDPATRLFVGQLSNGQWYAIVASPIEVSRTLHAASMAAQLHAERAYLNSFDSMIPEDVVA